MKLKATIALIFFSFTSFFVLSSLILKFLHITRSHYCDCKVCSAYLTGSWSAQFPNLADWYVYLLRHSRTGTIHIHVLNNIVTANPTNVEHMLKKNFHNYPKGKRFSEILGDLLGEGIFNSDGPAWHSQRKAASFALGGASMRNNAFTVVTEEIKTHLVPVLSSMEEPVDLQEVFRQFAFRTICKISFGLAPEKLDLPLPLSNYVAAIDKASRFSALRATSVSPFIWKVKRFLNIGSERELKQAIGMVDELAIAIINERLKLGFENNQDLLSRFIIADGTKINNKYLRDIIVSFLLAGRDTVASGLSSFFLLISKNPSSLIAIREEIADITKGKLNNEPSYQELKSMNYLHAALHESMRLLPPIPFDSKFSIDDDELPDGTYITKGTRVTYHPYAMGRMKSIWGPDCEEFKPERWLNEDNIFEPKSPFKFPVFQAGMRVCLGRELAIIEMKTLIVSVLREFDVDVMLRNGEFPRFAPGLTASFKGGIPARIRRR